jgi:hypothetical protein
LGVTALGFSIFAYVDGDVLQELIDLADVDWSVHIYGSTAILFMIASSIVIVISFLGCCGAIKVLTQLSSFESRNSSQNFFMENKCFLGLFIIIMVAIFGTVIAGIIMGTTQVLLK